MNEGACKKRHGANFPTPKRPAIYNFDIPIDTMNVVRARFEAAHIINKENYLLFAASNSEKSKFILAFVKDIRVRKLRDTNLFYTAVKTRTLLDHLQSMCVGLHATDVLNLKNDTQMYHEDMEGIPKYINKLEDAQKQSNWVGNPITDPTILLFASNAMLRTDHFPCANEKCE